MNSKQILTVYDQTLDFLMGTTLIKTKFPTQDASSFGMAITKNLSVVLIINDQDDLAHKVYEFNIPSRTHNVYLNAIEFFNPKTQVEINKAIDWMKLRLDLVALNLKYEQEDLNDN